MKVALVLIVLIIPLYFFRSVFIEPYDIKYVQDHYYHSQWEIPNSPWGIGDDGLYQFSGYELIRGRDPLTISPEVPPIGKLLYGLSILLFNNPYFVIIPIYLITIISFYYLTKSYLAVFFLVTTPLFFTQLNSTTLDLMQTCWLLLHTLAIFNKKTLFAGLTFGLFIGTKFGAFSVFLILADIYILYKEHRLKSLVWIFLIGLGVYFASYFGHFLHGGTIITWLKGQKWILNFYFAGQAKGTPFFVFITLFTGIWTNLQSAREWTILWPAAMAAFIFTKKNTLFLNYAAIFLAGVLITLCFSYYWVRYFLILLPFLIIFLVKIKSKLIYLVAIISFFSMIFYPYASLDKTKEEIKYAWEQGLYQDLYNYLPKQYSRTEFTQKAKTVDHGLEYPTKSVTFTKNTVTIVYQTKSGTITNTQPINFISENGRFKLIWDWKFVEPVALPITVHEPGLDGNNYWENLPYIYVDPAKITDQNREFILQNLADVTKLSKEKIRILLFVKAQKNQQIPIGFYLIGKLNCGEACKTITKPAWLYNDFKCNGLPYVLSERVTII